MSREINAMSPFTHNLYLYQLDFYQESLNDPTLAGTLKTHLVGRVLTLSIALALHAEAVCRAVAICFLKLEEIFCQVDNEALKEQETLCSLALSTSLRSFIGLFDRDYLEHYVAPIQPPILAAQAEAAPIEPPVAEPQQEPVQPPQVLLQPPRPRIQDEEQHQLDPWQQLNQHPEFGPYPNGIRHVANTGLLPPLPIRTITTSEAGSSDYDNVPVLNIQQHQTDEKEEKVELFNITPRSLQSQSSYVLIGNKDSPRTVYSLDSDDRTLQPNIPLSKRPNDNNDKKWLAFDTQIGPYSVSVCSFSDQEIKPIQFINATVELEIPNQATKAHIVGFFDPRDERKPEAALFLQERFQMEFKKQIPIYNNPGLTNQGITLAFNDIFKQLHMQFARMENPSSASIALMIILNNSIWIVQIGSSGILLMTQKCCFFEPKKTSFGPYDHRPELAHFPLQQFEPTDKILIGTHDLFKKVDVHTLQHWMQEEDPQLAESITFSAKPAQKPISCLVLSLNPHHVIEMD